MTRARRASRPRFRLLPTVLLTLAILGLPTVVYAWGRSSSSFDIAHRPGGRHAPRPREEGAAAAAPGLRRAQPVHRHRRRRAQDARAARLRLRRERRPGLPRHARGHHHRVRAGGLRPGRRPLVRDRRERLRHLHGRGGRPTSSAQGQGRPPAPSASPSAAAASAESPTADEESAAARGPTPALRRCRATAATRGSVDRASRRRPGAGVAAAAAHRRLRPGAPEGAS